MLCHADPTADVLHAWVMGGATLAHKLAELNMALGVLN
jgi:hypothetical protein